VLNPSFWERRVRYVPMVFSDNYEDAGHSSAQNLVAL
jgi:hypothetical protein